MSENHGKQCGVAGRETERERGREKEKEDLKIPALKLLN